MPELPEVEYVARQLRAEVPGRRIERVDVLWSRTVEPVDAREFEVRVTGQRIERIDRRGKHLLISLDSGDMLVVHRRMTGNLIFARSPDEALYVRVIFTLDDGRLLLFTDPRKFGRVLLVSAGETSEALLALGPEPLDPGFTPRILAERLSGTRRPIKAVLLDQTVVAGLGNIYADEALFRARIHPLRPAASLTRREVAALRDAIVETLLDGIEHGGTTFGRHRDIYNEAGRNLEHLRVYRRTGEPCPRCGTPITRITVAQRGTHFCPQCQRECR
jgi:formamidopyrimidine-DNA glycosylase